MFYYTVLPLVAMNVHCVKRHKVGATGPMGATQTSLGTLEPDHFMKTSSRGLGYTMYMCTAYYTSVSYLK